jgi:hypothetical protein
MAVYLHCRIEFKIQDYEKLNNYFGSKINFVDFCYKQLDGESV